MGEPLRDIPHIGAATPHTARTRLGERLLRIREQIVASGEPLLSWTEVEREVAERRGELSSKADDNHFR